MTAAEVITGDRRFSVECADALAWLAALPNDSIDLLFCSPPYEKARTYGIGFSLAGQKWVDWMHAIIAAAAPKVTGLIAVNCEGQTRGYSYSGVPFLLFADLKRAGFNLRKPVVFQRNGVCGGGGNAAQHAENGGSADWLRNDWEPILCITRPGKLPWADTLAMGHAPKWAPGGEMSNRHADGTRLNVNQWGHSTKSATAAARKANGERDKKPRPSHRNAHGVSDTTTRRRTGTDVKEKQGYAVRRGADGNLQNCAYDPPAIANPGNVIRLGVGGGQMGHDLAHENEAPFPLELPTFFVRSFCRPGGIVADCFCGSGTTAHAAIEWGRRFIGCDIRESQVALTLRRLATVQPVLEGLA